MEKNKSLEEIVEDIAKKQLDKIKYFTKTETINKEIEDALKKAPSKKGGTGTNFPDIKLLLKTKELKSIPVMIEVKGIKGKLIKLSANGDIENRTKKGEPNYRNISQYAVNGAIHYANAIIDNTESYKEAIAIGINGYTLNDELKIEIGVYYLSRDNFNIPKEVDKYTDLSFLLPENNNEFFDKINELNLSQEELEEKTREYENNIEAKLKKLNQTMHDDLKISVGSRVELITGMIMAGLGVENKVSPLEISDLKGEEGTKSNDGFVIINKISSFLD